VELVPQAVKAFFEENQITPTHSLRNPFATYQHSNLTLLQGDIFQISSEHLEDQPIRAVFDRASLIALPNELRKNYVALLRSLVSPNTKLLLVTLAYEDGVISGPPHSVPENEIFDLFAFAINIELLEKQDILPESPNFQKAGLRWAYEAVYLITFP
jgi:thiopurine S-methyltransferase